MNTKKVCAPSDGAIDSEISKYRSNVKKLQMRIVKAQKQGKHKIGTRNWVFAAKNQKCELKQLITAASTKIIRHTKIRQGANPYDSEWQVYFEEREGDRMFEGMSGRKALKKMWSKQKGKCTLCEDEINKASGWRLHIAEQDKKEIVHPECHKRIHPEMINSAG